MKYFKTFDQLKESLNEREYSDKERKDMADKGLALPDGSFPVKDLEDLKNAIQAYGRSKDQAAAAKFIAKRAKELSAEDLIPDTEDFQNSLKESIDIKKLKVDSILNFADVELVGEAAIKTVHAMLFKNKGFKAIVKSERATAIRKAIEAEGISTKGVSDDELIHIAKDLINKTVNEADFGKPANVTGCN